MIDRAIAVRRAVPRKPGPGQAAVPGERAAGRARELLLVGAGSLLTAGAMTWPVLRHPMRTVPQDLVDPLYFAWQVAWTGHALGADPARMYTTNAFLGAHGNLAYTDTVLGYAPFAAVVTRVVPGIDGALLTVNLLYVLAAALALGGAYLLARALGAAVPGALVAAAGYAFAPWHLAHARHLNVISTGGIVLALALLSYGHGWRLTRGPGDPSRPARPGFVLAGWLVAGWQLSLGFALGVPFAWVLALLLAVVAVTGLTRGRRGGQRQDRRVLLADLAGAAGFGLTGLLLALPYRSVVADFPAARRTAQMVQVYSPPVRGLVTAPPESWWWGGLQAGLRHGMRAVPEQALLPGFGLTGLALIGLFWSAWSLRHRLLLGLAIAVTGVLAVGASGPAGGEWTYLWVFRHVPGFAAVRTPGRLILWITLALALLAAGAVTRAAQRAEPAPERPGRHPARSSRAAALALSAGLLLPAGLVLAEGIGSVAQPVVPRPAVALRSLPGPVLVLPTSQQGDYVPMAWSTDGWPVLVNGGSGFEPPVQSALRRTALAFPAPASVAALRRTGVRTVLLARPLAAGTGWAALAAEPDAVLAGQAAAAGIGFRVVGRTVIYDLG